jgi:hypothetical protein
LATKEAELPTKLKAFEQVGNFYNWLTMQFHYAPRVAFFECEFMD